MTELPRGWAWATLGEVCAVTLGQSPPGSSYNDGAVGMPFFQGKAEFRDLRPTIRKWTTNPTKVATEGDVLVSVRAPVGPTNLAPCKCAIGRGLASLHPLGGIDPRYVLYAVRATERQLAARGTGTTFGAISGAVLRSHPLALAPLAEQRRIVAAIEEQLSRVDAARVSLEDASQRLGVLIDAVLALGEDAPRVRLGEIAVDARYGTSTKCTYEADGSPVLRIPNIRDRRVDVQDLKRAVDPAADVGAVETGDLLFIRTNGSRDLIGRVAVVESNAAGMGFASYLIRVRLDPARVDPHFAALALSTRRIRADIESRAASTAGQYNLNLRAIGELPIPLPSLAEQRRLRIEIESQLDCMRRLGAEVAEVKVRSKSLRHAILARAFRGELAPQDANDESGSALLVRIASERSATPEPTRKPKERTPA